MKHLAILDYGLGNIYAIQKACNQFNVKTIITNDKKKILSADGLILPGVGAFKTAMNRLNALELTESIKSFKKTGKNIVGICLGMQCAVIDFSRHLCGMKAANSTEFNKRTRFPVIDLMKSQKKVVDKGASMRLGSYSCSVSSGTKAASAYRKKSIKERHRHRYEFNNKYKRNL